MNTDERIAALKALADRTRITLVNALLEKPHCAEELAERTRLAPSTISFHLRRLEAAGLVTKRKEQYYVFYELRADLLRLTLRELVALPPREDDPERQRLERYREQVVEGFFRDGRLVQLPKKWRKRAIVLEEFLGEFETDREYGEREVNERIGKRYEDYCTIRRMLVDEGYMTRTAGVYRLTSKGRAPMASRSEMKRTYKETPREAGVFQVKNTVEGKILLGSSLNLHGPLNRHRFLLSIGRHLNPRVQEDWDRLGPEAFTFEILEVVKRREDPGFSVEDELALLEETWLEKLKPFGERGYNREGASIREA